jgi:hypothetical protein
VRGIRFSRHPTVSGNKTASTSFWLDQKRSIPFRSIGREFPAKSLGAYLFDGMTEGDDEGFPNSRALSRCSTDVWNASRSQCIFAYDLRSGCCISLFFSWGDLRELLP